MLTHAPAAARARSAPRFSGPVAAPPATIAGLREEAGKSACACGGGCPRCAGAVQPKLRVGNVDDPAEREADALADAVMRAPAGAAGEEPGPGKRAVRRVAAPGARAMAAGGMPLSPSAAAGIDAATRNGDPLPSGVRAVMEPRFGADFSGVRIHRGSDAAASAAEIGAHAYTLGNDIVFGDGAFAPSTEQGRHLIAHELAHVVQGAGASAPLLRRKEIQVSVVGAFKRLPPQDWHDLHRKEWQHVSATGTEWRLSPSNTFMRAAWDNTLNLRPAEYQTVSERHDYYDLISYVIENDPGTPKAARGVRFFHAATSVTGSPGIGSVDKPIGHIKLGADTRQILRDVNVELFALNMGVIRNLLSNWKEPRDPVNPSGAISAFEFDIRMVETEQATVESFISKNKARFTSTVVDEINDSMDPNVFGQFFNFSKRSFEWASKALGVPRPNFTIEAHRQAIGFASVHIFHRRSEADYLAFMQPRVGLARSSGLYIIKDGEVTVNAGLSPLKTFVLASGTSVEVRNWSSMMGPHQIGDRYAGKVEVLVNDGASAGQTGWVDYADLR